MSEVQNQLISQLARYSASDHSPCVGHCTYDDKDFCLSCRRSTNEIGSWRDADNALREAAWARIPGDIDQAGLDTMRLPLSPDDIAEIALDILDHGGSWAIGGGGHYAYVHDLVAEENGVLSAVSEDGMTKMTLDLSGKMQALAWARGSSKAQTLADNLDALPLILVVPQARLNLPCHDQETALDDGTLDLGFGLPHCQMIASGQDMMMRSMLAEACITNGAAYLNAPNDHILPESMVLPESYVLAAVLLPKGEALL